MHAGVSLFSEEEVGGTFFCFLFFCFWFCPYMFRFFTHICLFMKGGGLYCKFSLPNLDAMEADDSCSFILVSTEEVEDVVSSTKKVSH